MEFLLYTQLLTIVYKLVALGMFHGCKVYVFIFNILATVLVVSLVFIIIMYL